MSVWSGHGSAVLAAVVGAAAAHLYSVWPGIRQVVKMADGDDNAWDTATLGLLAGFVVLLIVAAVVARLPMKGLVMLALFKPRIEGWNAANCISVLVVIGSLSAYSYSLSMGLNLSRREALLVRASGLTAGLAMPLPIWWSSLRAGVHSIANMSREAAWRIHAAFGFSALVFGSIHGAFALRHVSGIFTNTFWVVGFVGLAFMWLGYLPVWVHVFAPSLLSYDRWKLVHFLSPVGYLLSVVHVLDHARVYRTASVLAIAVVMLAASAAHLWQKVRKARKSFKATVLSCEISSDSEGTHTFLHLRAPGFKFKPGQWAYLQVRSASVVHHPFTIVPDPDEPSNRIRFYIRTQGAFTRALADKQGVARPDRLRQIRISGPYGRPPLPARGADAVVFVLGGVGITPALSLLPEALKTRKPGLVRVFWSMRSPRLLQKCAPMLEPHLTPGLHCIRMREGARPRPQASDGGLLLGAGEGRADVAEWLQTVGAELTAAGAKRALLYVCAPGGLAECASSAIAQVGGLRWRVHLERFHLLVSPLGGGRAARVFPEVLSGASPSAAWASPTAGAAPPDGVFGVPAPASPAVDSDSAGGAAAGVEEKAAD